MQRSWTLVSRASILFVLALTFGGLAVSARMDVGQQAQHDLEAKSVQEFGVVRGVDHSSTTSIDAATASTDPTKLATVARGLKVRVVTSGVAAPNLDMMAFWPNDQNPEWIIECNEQGTTDPGLQRIRVSDGKVETIVTGTDSCDPVHRTPWGTIVFGEEADTTGHVYELINPLATTDVTLDRITGTFSGGTGSENLVEHPALGNLSFEGIAIYPNGVVYYGDENRPSKETSGGAYFKFIPSNLRDVNAGTITSLDDSPLASGSVYGLRLGMHGNSTDYGQGSNTGLGNWIAVSSANLRQEAAELHLTGYYRPEDVAIDEAALAVGNVRFCGNNTGNEFEAHNWGGTICVTDGTLSDAGGNAAAPEVQDFQLGTPERQMVDNIAYQPGRGNWILHEDADVGETGKNDDLWACLPDGADDDQLSDGCLRIATLNDLSAEWTGGAFDATGKRFFVSVQHNVTGHGVLLEISGWK